ncbi:PhzF family phenazine biosynthesis protein [Propionicicella superfundia]|uniref:PhzF family phenazine biosynthesis protein n=1 Tax=Propionicicella superfundia TaxID=348582 RepID=UPI0004258969|nr:PhzF family phenazine biosynthesis protein [Propionicicella superfundia]
MPHRFHEVDVFTAVALRGNPLAVVHAAEDVPESAMADFARWTNFSETTFLLPPVDPAADYRVRIFTPGGELPFAGHPTLGSCWAWLEAGGRPQADDVVVQECGVGLVPVRRDGQRLAFAAPPLRRSGPVAADILARIVGALGIAPEDVRGHAWVDNGPGWCAVMLPTAEAVLALRPDAAALGGLALGVVGPQPDGHPTAFEVRAFVSTLGVAEDPVTGSLNAGLAQWLIGEGIAPARYVVSQGAALGRDGRVHVERVGDDIWIGGDVTPIVAGAVSLGV